jgi:hypothetical protein
MEPNSSTLLGLSSLLTGGDSSFGIFSTPLKSSSYTLGTLILDTSTSTSSWLQQLKDSMKLLIKGLKQFGTASNIILRVVHFGTNIVELIPFTPIDFININDIDKMCTNGQTSLYRTSVDCLDASVTYADFLASEGYIVNVNNYMYSDGDNYVNPTDNFTIKSYAEAKQKLKAQLSEAYFYQDFLIGLGTGTALDNFAKISNFTMYKTYGDPGTNPGELAKAGGFVSKSLELRSNILQPKNRTVPDPNSTQSLSII